MAMGRSSMSGGSDERPAQIIDYEELLSLVHPNRVVEIINNLTERGGSQVDMVRRLRLTLLDTVAALDEAFPPQ